jgi:ligand-binding sensor domain-containing protein/signal transduction histidine kinase
VKRGVLILLACWRCAYALNPALDISQYAHKAWTVRDGFFKGSITSITQTPDGYLWLATEFGLLRFDGVRTVPFRAGEQLPSSYVVSLITTHDGRLWIGTRQGLASWKDGKLTQYPEFAGRSVAALLEDREGTVWASASAIPTGRLCAFRSGVAQCYGDDGGLGHGVISLYEDPRGNLWAGASHRLWRWKPGLPEPYPIPGPSGDIYSLAEGDDGRLWIALLDELRRMVNGRVETYSIPGAGRFRPRSLLRDRDGGLWIGTNDRGLLHVHKGRTDVFGRPDGLSDDRATRIFEDREGNIWVGTNNGLDLFRDFAVPTISVRQGLSDDRIQSVLAAGDGSVWLGTPQGLDRWKNGQIKAYSKRNSGLPDDLVEAIYEDHRGRIWASTLRGVAFLEADRFIAVAGVPGGVAHSIAEDNSGDLWIGNQDQGLYKVAGGRVVEQIPWARLGRQDHASPVLGDPVKGGLWLGFYHGGLAYFKDGQVQASYGRGDGLRDGEVFDLQLDREGILWAATAGGLSRLKSGRAVTLTTKNGLPCDGVYWALEDSDHSFWLDTACGLVRITRTELDAWAVDPTTTFQTVVFDSGDGVRNHVRPSGYGPHVAKSADGRLWFFAGEGVSVVDPRHLPFNRLPPPVHIEQITADRTIRDVAPGIRLPALSRDLEIDYTALSLVAPEKNRFRVKLEGWDQDWKDMGNERKAFYGNLPPRNYRFRVMASNNSGVWNEAGASFDFSIAPAYYETAWFRVSCATAFLALLWGLYRYRLHQVAREFNMRLDERVGERTRLARDLHDTLLQGFQGLMLRLQAIHNSLPEGKLKAELERTLDRGDQVAAESRKAVHDLRLSTVITNDLARAVKTLGDELSSENSATFALLVEGETRELHPIVRGEVYRITREALRNAFIHARAHHIEAEIIYAENLFRFRLRDDGAGIAPAILEEGRQGHYGLSGMRERASEIGAKLDIWSGVETGTEIDLSIVGSIAYTKRPGGVKAE